MITVGSAHIRRMLEYVLTKGRGGGEREIMQGRAHIGRRRDPHVKYRQAPTLDLYVN